MEWARLAIGSWRFLEDRTGEITVPPRLSVKSNPTL
jgi:hypothetical protein